MILTWTEHTNCKVTSLVEHCCDTMRAAFDNDNIVFGNPDRYRDRNINILYKIDDYENDYIVIPISFCPFCKKKVSVIEVELTDSGRLDDAERTLDLERIDLEKYLKGIPWRESKVVAAEAQYDKLLQQYKDKHET